MRKVVFVERAGGHKAEDAWACSCEAEAENLRKFLRHLGVRNVRVISLEDYGRLPERHPE